MWVALLDLFLRDLGAARGDQSLPTCRAGGMLWSCLHSKLARRHSKGVAISLWYPFNTSPGCRRLHAIAVLPTPWSLSFLIFKRCGQHHLISLWVQAYHLQPPPPPVPLSAALSASPSLPFITLVTYLAPVWYLQMLGSPSSVVLSGDHHSRWPKGSMWENRTPWFQDHQHRKQADT